MAKDQFEREFVDYLGDLRPKAEYVRLFREVVLGCVEKEAERCQDDFGCFEKRIKELEEQRQKLLEAHVYKNTLDAEIYRRETSVFRRKSP